MIGTTRKINTSLSTVDFTRLPSNGSKVPSEDQKESLIFRIHPEREGRHLIFQLGTSDPGRAVQAAKLVAADVAGIDVNAGCPKPFSTSGGMGAALLKTPDLLASILKALVEEVGKEFEIGISVKIRLLETPELTESLVRKLCATGITGLTVHCRTTPMRPRERAIREQLRMIADICREHGVASIMNGDVENREQALALTDEFGVDGAMIATAAETNSSCFRAKENSGLAPWQEVVDLYMKFSMEVENRWGNTKYLLGHLIPGKSPFHSKVVGTKNYSQACQVLELEHLKEMALETDTKLDLLPHLQEQTKWAKKRKNKAAEQQKGKEKQQRVESPKASPEASLKAEIQPEKMEDSAPSIALTA